MKNIRKHKKTTYLPRVKQSDILEITKECNISRMHLGLDPYPYLWYKRSYQLGKAKMYKFLDQEKMDIMIAYCYASRKTRRELPMFHKCYMTILSILRVKLDTEKINKEIKELNEEIAKLEKKLNIKQ